MGYTLRQVRAFAAAAARSERRRARDRALALRLAFGAEGKDFTAYLRGLDE